MGFKIMHARSTLFTVLGEYVHPTKKAVWVGTLLTWMNVLGFNEPAVRAALSRAGRTGWLEVHKSGRKSFYAITPDVRWRIDGLLERLYPKADNHWDGLWRVLVYTIPEAKRDKRDRFRKELGIMGYGMLSPGVWICPNPKAKEALELAKAHGLEQEVEVFEAQRLKDNHHDVVASSWNLTYINDYYVQFLAEFSHAPLPEQEEQAFYEFIRMMHAYRKFLFFDPSLPVELLPSGDLSKEVQKLYFARRDTLKAHAAPFIHKTFETL